MWLRYYRAKAKVKARVRGWWRRGRTHREMQSELRDLIRDVERHTS